MKKLAIAVVAAITATVSLSSAAEAHRRHDDDWGYPRHHRYWDDVDYRHDDYRRDDCSTIKIVKRDDWGNKVIKIIKQCD